MNWQRSLNLKISSVESFRFWNVGYFLFWSVVPQVQVLQQVLHGRRARTWPGHCDDQKTCLNMTNSSSMPTISNGTFSPVEYVCKFHVYFYFSFKVWICNDMNIYYICHCWYRGTWFAVAWRPNTDQNVKKPDPVSTANFVMLLTCYQKMWFQASIISE